MTVKGLWNNPPAWWSADVPFIDPNNRKRTKAEDGSHTKKPTKDEILPMLIYLFRLCKVTVWTSFCLLYFMWFLCHCIRSSQLCTSSCCIFCTGRCMPPHHNRFTALLPGPPGWACARRELLDFMRQGKINRGRQTDHPTGCHSIQTNQCPPPSSPHFFLSGYPSCCSTISAKALKVTNTFGLRRRR